jgi:hypothetical protein
MNYNYGSVMVVIVPVVMTAVMAIGLCKCAYGEQHEQRE